MHLRLKTKITLVTAFLVLAVVGVNSTLYVANLSRGKSSGKRTSALNWFPGTSFLRRKTRW